MQWLYSYLKITGLNVYSYRFTSFNAPSLYRLPTFGYSFISDSSVFISDGVNTTSVAFAFSSRYFLFFVPGIGTISSPFANTQANASCAGVHPLSAAIVANLSTSFMLLSQC